MKKIFTLFFMACTYLGFSQPMMSATAPTQPSSEVVSIFSQAYTDVTGVNLYPNWGQATQFAWHTIGMDSIIQYSSLNYQGIEYSSAAATDVNGATLKTVHFDIWTSNLSDIDIFLIDRSGQERSIRKTLTANAWNSIDIDIADYAALGMPVTSLWQFKFVDPNNTSATFYVDNIYFYGSVTVSEPDMKADDPRQSAQNVFSVYSESYNDPAGVDYYPNWGQSTTFTEFVIGEDSMIKYGNINYQGITFGEDKDLSQMEFLHLDVWSANVDTLLVFINGNSSDEKSIKAELKEAAWTSLDIPLSEYTDQDVSLLDIKEIKLEDLARAGGDIFVDNIFFYKIPVPVTAAPTPTAKEKNVMSVYSNAYTSVPVNTFRTDWSVGDLEETQLEGDDVLRYYNLDFVGIEMTGDNSLDITEMDSVRFDVWTGDADIYRIKVVDFGADNASGGGDDSEHSIEIAGAPKEQWITHKIAISDLTELKATSNISQIIFSAQPVRNSTLYIDNMLFSKQDVNSISLADFAEAKIFPNPANEILNINLNANGTTVKSLEVINLQGQILLTETVNSPIVNTSLDLSSIESGIYFLNIETDRGTIAQRFLIH